MKVNYIYRRYEHHSIHAGYEQLARYAGGNKEIINVEKMASSWVPWRVANYFVNRAGMRSYIPRSFYTEVDIIKRALLEKNQIFHFLYGEDACRYSLHFNKIRNNHIIANMHHPPHIFEEFYPKTEVLRKLSALIVCAEYAKPYFSELCGSEEKVHVIPLGIDTEYYKPAMDLSVKERMCLFCGFYLRDFDLMRQVVDLVKGKDSSIIFNLVTRKDMADKFKGCTNVVFESGISEEALLNRYHRASLFVMPFIDTTSNTGITEALACGLPIISNDVGGIKEYVDESSGIIAGKSDAQGMADAVIELMDNDQKRFELSKGARKKAESIDWKIIAKEMTDLYQKVAS